MKVICYAVAPLERAESRRDVSLPARRECSVVGHPARQTQHQQQAQSPAILLPLP